MALNYLAKALDGPVTKPSGHEPLATHVQKLMSGAMNYHGLPITPDARLTLAGAAGAPKALLTKPTRHEPAFYSNIPLPFHENIYNANALHVPDIETLGSEAAKRKEIRREAAIRQSFVPTSGPIGVMHTANIEALQSRLQEKRLQMIRSGIAPDQVESLLEPDYQGLRAATIQAAEAGGGMTPTQLKVNTLLGQKVPRAEFEAQKQRYRELLQATMVEPFALPEGVAGPRTAEMANAAARLDATVESLMPDPGLSVADPSEIAARSRAAMNSIPTHTATTYSRRQHTERALDPAIPVITPGIVAAPAAPAATNTAMSGPPALGSGKTPEGVAPFSPSGAVRPWYGEGAAGATPKQAPPITSMSKVYIASNAANEAKEDEAVPEYRTPVKTLPLGGARGSNALGGGGEDMSGAAGAGANYGEVSTPGSIGASALGKFATPRLSEEEQAMRNQLTGLESSYLKMRAHAQWRDSLEPGPRRQNAIVAADMAAARGEKPPAGIGAVYKKLLHGTAAARR